MKDQHGRVYIGPEPADGPHPGYRGRIELGRSGQWVHIEGEYLCILDSDSHDWEPLAHIVTIPSTSIHLIEWEPS